MNIHIYVGIMICAFAISTARLRSGPKWRNLFKKISPLASLGRNDGIVA